MADKDRIYMDSCCFIDAVKQKVGIALSADREKDVWHIKQLLQAHRDGEVEVFTSSITVAECSHVEGNVSQPVRDAFNVFLMSGQYLFLVQPTPFIVENARNLRWGHGLSLGGADAIHVATAIDRKCREFVTTDKQVAKLNGNTGVKLSGLRATMGRNTHCLPDKYREEKML